MRPFMHSPEFGKTLLCSLHQMASLLTVMTAVNHKTVQCNLVMRRFCRATCGRQLATSVIGEFVSWRFIRVEQYYRDTSDDGDEGKAQADWLWRVSCQSTGVVDTVLHHCPTQVVVDVCSSMPDPYTPAMFDASRPRQVSTRITDAYGTDHSGLFASYHTSRRLRGITYFAYAVHVATSSCSDGHLNDGQWFVRIARVGRSSYAG